MCTLVRVSLLFLVYINNSKIQAEIHEDPCIKPCGLGQYYLNVTCSCLDCPAGSYNPSIVHRDNTCIPHSHALYEGCTLIHKGTSTSDNKWLCPTTTIPTTSVNTTVLSVSGTTLANSAPQETANYLVIIIPSVALLIVIIVSLIVAVWFRKCRDRSEQQNIPETKEMMLRS
uniref:TNFR-Cys domain-containing protein n=1 Tax=Biomphalaria glabrata TaxID=6526 RepID=A0A2C9M4M6_BIOGL